MRPARWILAATTLSLALTAAACPRKREPNPLPTVTQPVVQVCLDDATRVRQEDARCDEGLSIFHWVYVANAPNALDLPAVGQTLGAGRGTTEAPTGVVIGRVPREGGRFADPDGGR